MPRPVVDVHRIGRFDAKWGDESPGAAITLIVTRELLPS
jgi:hypothetical protein